MATATLKNVELVKVGDWAAAQGSGKVTREDIASAVEAFSDQLVDRPALKIGHQDDNTFNASTNDGAGDGEPAYGWIENVTAGEQGNTERPNPDTLYGDLVGMPAQLAEIVPTAYRRRSVELLRGIKTAAGKTYTAVLTGMAFLGITRPAVKSLADVIALYSEPPAVTGTLSVLTLMDGLTAEQVVTFSAVLDDLNAVHNTDVIPPRSDKPSDSDVVEQTTAKENKMPALTKDDVIKALDAEGDKSVEDRLAELVTPPEPTDEEKAAAEKVEADKKAADEKAAADAAAAEAAKGEGGEGGEGGDKPETVTLSAAQYAEITKGVEAGTQAAKILDDQRRTALVDEAFKGGKIARTELSEWRKALDRDEEGTKTLLSSLTPRFAVTEIGDEAAPTELAEAQSKAEDSWVATHFPSAVPVV